MESTSSRVSESGVITQLAKLPHGRASFKQLVKELGVKGGMREELDHVLARLVERGTLIELRSGQYVLARMSREFAVGRLNMHRDGYGFLISDTPIEGIKGDIYIPQSSAETAMHGDRVVVQISRIEHSGRADGEIYEVLKRAHETIVGQFRIHKKANYVIPSEDRIQQWIEIPDGMEMPPDLPPSERIGAPRRTVASVEELDGLVVNVELLDFPEKDGHAVGRVIEILGHPDDFGIDVEITIRKFHIPHEFPPAVLNQARQIPEVIPEEELRDREDFRSFEIVTIDGETARDFDDAVWVDKQGNGNYALHVHIADVSHYVRPGSPIDLEAASRGTSVYFPDRAVPMLPLELSTGICSLKPEVDRLVLSALLEIDHRGETISQRFATGIIKSQERMTYTNVHLLLEGDTAQRERYAQLVPRFELMKELALILNRRRVRRGSIDFDMPEPLIQFDTSGEMVGVVKHPRNIAHRIIEEFMLAANEAVASALQTAERPSLYRIHEPPNPQRILEFQETAAHFGYGLDLGGVPFKKFKQVQRARDGRKIRKDVVVADESFQVSPKVYQKLVARIEGKPEERILSYLMLRSLKQARYSAENKGHFALATDFYTHFTSPIRRYPDLIVHRVLKEYLLKVPSSLRDDELVGIAEDSSRTERRASDAERELVEWKKIRFMADRVGEEFQALLTSTTRFGFFVELEELFVEGLVPIDTLPGDRYAYQENNRRIIGERTQRAFTIGDTVRVCLAKIDTVEKKLTFSLVEPVSTKRRHKPKR